MFTLKVYTANWVCGFFQILLPDFFLLSPFFNVNFGIETTKLPLKYNDLLIFLTLLQDLTSISQMIPKTKQNIDYKYTKISIEFFSSLNSEDNLILSPRLLFVTENEVKIRPFFKISGLLLLVMNLSNSRYAYSNLNLHFLHAFLWHLSIHLNIFFAQS